MQIYARDHIEVHPQRRKEVLYLVKEKEKNEQRNSMDINCELLLQEFNKHLLFIYNNAIESYCIFFMSNVVINVIHHCLQHHHQRWCEHLDHHHLCHQH